MPDRLRRIKVVRERLGDPGVRDPDLPCREFEPGSPGSGECESDGHYLCVECRWLCARALEERRRRPTPARQESDRRPS